MSTIDRYLRADLRTMAPYSSARDEFEGSASVWLDANENPLLTDWNRYPDPLQKELKTAIAGLKNVPETNLFLGNGSDEVLDLLFRLIARPFSGKVAFFNPSYGMYEVLARLNGLEQVRIPLQPDFSPDWEQTAMLIRDTQLFVVCRPNNPVGNLFDQKQLIQLLENYGGVMIVDEAYIDFGSETSIAEWVNDFPNLVIVQTLSKAYGMAGLRIGMAIANSEWITALNRIKPPYNISSIVQQTALELLKTSDFDAAMTTLKRERNRVQTFLEQSPIVREVIPSEANFLLFRVDNAETLYALLAEKGIVVRNRSKQLHCENMLRVTIGTPEENTLFINTLKTIQS